MEYLIYSNQLSENTDSFYSDQTANSFPPGSLKWNLLPPGNENISLTISAFSFFTFQELPLDYLSIKQLVLSHENNLKRD